jgi:hypothetical protein
MCVCVCVLCTGAIRNTIARTQFRAGTPCRVPARSGASLSVHFRRKPHPAGRIVQDRSPNRRRPQLMGETDCSAAKNENGKSDMIAVVRFSADVGDIRDVFRECVWELG